jgi:hypothetical protein
MSFRAMSFRTILGITLAAYLVGPLAGVSKVGAQSASVSNAIENWSVANGVGVTAEAQAQLASRTVRAVQAVKQRQPSVSTSRLQELAPEAAVSHLEKSQKDGRAPSVAVLLEGLATGRAAAVVNAPTELPILYVDITPPQPSNFVVAIDGTAFRAGLNVFRVSEGQRAIHVTREAIAPCDKTLAVTKVGPNRVHCPM